MADWVVFLHDGVAVSGTVDELLASDDRRVVEFLEAEDAGASAGSGSPPREIA